jgi:hypothetical protein
VLAWTYHSHHGGEEQALFGLIDHDDRPSWKLDEFATIAAEFEKLQDRVLRSAGAFDRGSDGALLER